MYITRADYLVFDGVDLEIELPDDDNSTNKVERFINEVERKFFRMAKYYGFNKDKITDDNIDDVKEAIMYQIRHFLKYGRDNVFDADAFETLHTAGLAGVQYGN